MYQIKKKQRHLICPFHQIYWNSCMLQRSSFSFYTNISFIFDHIRILSCIKVKVTLVQALRFSTGPTAHRGSRGIALPFHDHGTKRGWGVSVTHRPLFTPGKTRYPLYRRLGGPQGRSGQVRKISPSTGIRSRTVQTVASRYTDWAIRPTCPIYI